MVKLTESSTDTLLMPVLRSYIEKMESRREKVPQTMGARYDEEEDVESSDQNEFDDQNEDDEGPCAKEIEAYNQHIQMQKREALLKKSMEQNTRPCSPKIKKRSHFSSVPPQSHGAHALPSSEHGRLEKSEQSRKTKQSGKKKSDCIGEVEEQHVKTSVSAGRRSHLKDLDLTAAENMPKVNVAPKSPVAIR